MSETRPYCPEHDQPLEWCAHSGRGLYDAELHARHTDACGQHPGMDQINCTCPPAGAGGLRNWNQSCPVHGTESGWTGWITSSGGE